MHHSSVEPDRIDRDGVDLEELRRRFPNLYEEYIREKKPVNQLYQHRDTDPWKDYNPDYKDFLARAKTDEECYEVIDYLFKIGEISPELAEKLRERTKTHGAEGFGSRHLDHYTKFSKGEEN